MGLGVLVQLCLLSKGSSADVTHVWLDSRVGPQVIDHVALFSEFAGTLVLHANEE